MTMLTTVLVGLTILAILWVLLRRKIIRIYHVITLFYPDRIVANFRSMNEIFAVETLRQSPVAHSFPRTPIPLPKTYTYQGQNRALARWIDETWTTGLIVIRDGQITCEEYYRGNSETTKTISWSMAKSFVSALVGIALAEGKIATIRDPVSHYVPQLAGSGYDGVAIKDVLQMSSGVKFDEDYAAFFSDINRMGRAMAFDSSIDEFVTSLQPERPPGTLLHYVSMDTQVLGMVLREATGETIRAYTESRLWQKLGMEADGYWLVDGQGMELVFGGLNAVLRDYARFGQLYLQEGTWDGEEIVPRNWIRASVRPDAPHLMPGTDLADSDFGYGYQWWIPPAPEGDYMAIVIYNQYIYVHPGHRVVIAKSSAYPDFNYDGSEKTLQSVAAFRAIAGAVP